MTNGLTRKTRKTHAEAKNHSKKQTYQDVNGNCFYFINGKLENMKLTKNS